MHPATMQSCLRITILATPVGTVQARQLFQHDDAIVISVMAYAKCQHKFKGVMQFCVDLALHQVHGANSQALHSPSQMLCCTIR